MKKRKLTKRKDGKMPAFKEVLKAIDASEVHTNIKRKLKNKVKKNGSKS